MPELPEVETTCRALEPFLVGSVVCDVVVRETRLRWPVVPDDLYSCRQLMFHGLFRRGKYLLIQLTEQDHLLIHLGMSGSLRMVDPAESWRKHDHIGITLSNGVAVRYHDPRRFGAILRWRGEWAGHFLLAHLGPEPLSDDFNPEYLWMRAQSRVRTSIKALIMDAHVVVGVGNIYAQEALYAAGIAPSRKADLLSKSECIRLVAAISQQLQKAIAAGGSTLRDYVHGRGEPGLFQVQFKVYGRKGQRCANCSMCLCTERIAGRTTTWCPQCQR